MKPPKAPSSPGSDRAQGALGSDRAQGVAGARARDPAPDIPDDRAATALGQSGAGPAAPSRHPAVSGRAADALDRALDRAAREGPARRAVVVGASAGGPAALRQLLSALDPALDAAVVVVLHVGADGPDLLPALLDPLSALPVMLARERCPLLPGVVHFAPSGYHLEVERERRFSLSADVRVCYSRPSIDVLFMSAAAAYGADLAGVVLSGASNDGAAGLALIRDLGGLALVQTPTDAEIDTMPAAALARAGADLCAPVADLAQRLSLFGQGR